MNVFYITEFNICCAIVFALIAPIGVIMAISSQEVGINGISELMIGYILPGRPIANMMFKTWCYNTASQAIRYTSDFKLGHYMKIPPRSMFFSQVASTIVAGTVQLCVQEWMFSNIEDMCSPDQKDGFICPEATVFGTASIIVCLSSGIDLLMFIAQCLILYCSGVSLGHSVCFHMDSSILASCFSSCSVRLHHYFSGFPKSSLGSNFSSTSTSRLSSAARPSCLRRRLSTMYPLCSFALSLTMSSVGAILTGGPNTTVSFHALCFCSLTKLSDVFVLTRDAMALALVDFIISLDVLSGGLDAGYEFGILIIFFALQYPKNGNIGLNSIQTWWGNTVYTKTDDYVGVPYKNPPEEGTFGPSSW